MLNWSTAHPGFSIGLISFQDQIVEVTIVLQSGTEFADTYATWIGDQKSYIWYTNPKELQ